MTFDGFASHGDGIVQILSGGKASRNVRDFYTPGVMVIAN
jgi:hypothetical protein